MTREMQRFSIIIFSVMGSALTAFLLLNPLELPFLPAHAASAGPSEAQVKEEGDRGADGQLYQCPMHPDVIETRPGECPKCGMELVPMNRDRAAAPGASGASSSGKNRKILYWYSPMDPTYIRSEPGLSPMGMKLVPKFADENTSGGSGVITINPTQVQNMGVVTAAARLGEVSRVIRTVGILDFNADLITWINTKFSGWIEKVHITYVGQQIKKGEPLFEIYSPELVTTQDEYLRALDYAKSVRASQGPEARRQADSLLRSTQDRLRYWDISEDQIRDLEKRHETRRRLTIFSPVDGVVVEVMDQALEGMFVRPGMNLYKIADLSTVWVHADVYESDLPWVRDGQAAEVSFRYQPNRVFRGQILFLYPEVSQATRTLKICIEVPNDNGRLRPGMYADVKLEGPPIPNAVLIPDAAVLRSGERDLVFIDQGGGHFEPREVKIGERGDGDVVQVLDGVLPGEAVVTQAQFMLDSESRVQEAIAKFMQQKPSATIPPAAQTAPSPGPPESESHP
ncbi:MAG: efflux RND transporter periplasmic adaptor subunit [Acidobacteriota bacterium]